MNRSSVVVVQAVTLGTAAMTAYQLPAFATHVHTSANGYYHGLGDGENFDNHIHPFSDYSSSNYMIADAWKYPSVVYQDGTSTHVHQTKDGVDAECQYAAGVSSQGASVGYHVHNHHYYCGM